MSMYCNEFEPRENLTMEINLTVVVVVLDDPTTYIHNYYVLCCYNDTISYLKKYTKKTFGGTFTESPPQDNIYFTTKTEDNKGKLDAAIESGDKEFEITLINRKNYADRWLNIKAYTPVNLVVVPDEICNIKPAK